LELQRQAQDVGSVAECRAALKSHPEDPALRLTLAKALAGAGQYQEALQASLSLVQDHKQQCGEPARKIMVDIFRVLPRDSELIDTYRRALAAALY
jgi:thioredoxin-like negative regulator of GroEL